jgi:hypothetical protein
LQPKPAGWLLSTDPAHGITENQFAFTTGIAGIDDLGHVRPFGQLLEQV